MRPILYFNKEGHSSKPTNAIKHNERRMPLSCVLVASIVAAKQVKNPTPIDTNYG
ncbi:hypothetical protein [Legionella tunisiensis]|uniref:hypothetical protein n=1 Tax=Legionella tunisiensis TaxID=1034944 RepID=UPI001E534AC5|nr:hypothetical protein [Legionella tunisiensis]